FRRAPQVRRKGESGTVFLRMMSLRRLTGAALAVALTAAPASVATMGAGVALARPAPDSFADLAEKLLPAVVNISTTQTLKAANPKLSLPDIPPGSPLEDL